jgi:subtilisin family serine protease
MMGTAHVAGIGARDNGLGIKGAVSDAEPMRSKPLIKMVPYLSSIIRIDWAISNDMDIINLSLGAQVGSVIKTWWIKHIMKDFTGIAAGNDGTDLRYCRLSLLSFSYGVGAIDQQNGMLLFFNRSIC